MYLRHTRRGIWLHQHVPPLLLPYTLEPLLASCGSLCRYDFRVIVQKLFTVCYSVTNTVQKVSLHEPVLTH